ncbi:MAG: hypothetical protein K8R40_08380 [Anaerolineaceae bacterium]|nr:hypothetical protein [Anaerolineaceae bacterium]
MKKNYSLIFSKFIVSFCFLPILSSCVQIFPPEENTGSILYSETFEANNGNWTELLEEDGSMIGYQAGGLRFVVNATQRDKISILKQGQNDAIISVDAQKLNGPDDNLMGIVCRWQNIGNYYAFLISSDAYYGIAQVQDGNYQMLTNEFMELNEDLIHQGNASNHIRVGCVQNALWLEVNDTVISGIYDDTFSTGKIGLLAGSTVEAGVDILFDNFTLTQP